MKNFLIFTFFLFFVCSTTYGQRILLSQGFENGPWTPDSLPQKWAKVKVIASTCTTGPVADWRARDSGEAFCGTNPINGYLSKAFNTKRGLSIPWTSGNGNNTDEWVFTDSLRIATGDSLIFWSQLGTWPGNTATYYLDSLQVWVTSAQTPASQIARLGTVRSLAAASNVWQEIKYDLSAYNGQRVYVSFRYFMNTSVDGIMVNVDSVMVRNLSSTPPPATCVYSWAGQTSGVTSTLYGVSAVNNSVAWSVGASNVVRRTVNGGTTWTSANGGGMTGTIYDIATIDSNIAIATTSDASGTVIYRTSNGGTSWTSVFTQTGGFINDIDMVSATEGYAEGDPVSLVWSVLKTTNGGVNWTAMAGVPNAIANEFGRIDNMSVSGTTIAFVSDANKVYYSNNSGTSWAVSTLTGFSSSSTATMCAHFTSANTGYIAATTMLKTVNGGVNWTAVTVPGVTSFANIDGFGNEIWTLGTSNVYRSTNAGSTWTTAYTGTGTLEDISLVVNAGCPVGWTSSSNGTIAKMSSSLVGTTTFSTEVPENYALLQNYPNPFNPSTNIRFSIPSAGFVTLKVYNTAGVMVASLVNENKAAGNYTIGFNASKLPSGAYFYRLETNNFVETKKMLLVK